MKSLTFLTTFSLPQTLHSIQFDAFAHAHQQSKIKYKELKKHTLNLKKSLKSINHKSIIFVFKNTKDVEVIKKFNNYKNLSFMSDSTYSVFKALKHEALFLSKNSELFTKHLNGIVK